jgi:cytidylate kinase
MDRIRTITISASYGTAGSVIGPKVAERLGLPFLDRAISTSVAAELAVPEEDVTSREERVESFLWRALSSLALATPNPGVAPISEPVSGEVLKQQTERRLHQIASETGGVILGRGAAIVLAGRSDALHVRLDGPMDARIQQAAALGGISADEARKMQRETDGARAQYLKHFYKADATDSRLYHLMIDATVIDADRCVELIVTAAGR